MLSKLIVGKRKTLYLNFQWGKSNPYKMELSGIYILNVGNPYPFMKPYDYEIISR